MRYPHLLPSRSDVNAFHLVGRSSRGTFVHARARRLDAIGVKKIFKAAPTTPPVSLVGKISQLAPTANGEALLVLGETGRVQSWEMGQDEVITDMAIAEAEVPPNAKIATWHDGKCQISPLQSWAALIVPVFRTILRCCRRPLSAYTQVPPLQATAVSRFARSRPAFRRPRDLLRRTGK